VLIILQSIASLEQLMFTSCAVQSHSLIRITQKEESKKKNVFSSKLN